VEAAELLELTQWKTAQELEGAKDDAIMIVRFSEEIADVFIYLLLISDKLGIDLLRATDNKLKENSRKYPVRKSRGSARKYSEL
jgi:NTP pyrophosphatase (non-canonical NTP hydrolase)